ncbi:transcriptional regulator [Klebsiella sp. KE9767]|uniref:winged helix-turn-helix domain-containing protein n=1 Tax=Klebsiella sp. KE9767 TaxID=3118151 RepID=UPI0037522727
MIYRINKIILFRDDDGQLWIEGNEESGYDLTPTTSRLLAFILKRRGEVLTRELIMTHVWDKYGLRSSNNSLNKYILI